MSDQAGMPMWNSAVRDVPVIDLGLDRPRDQADRAAAARAVGQACATNGFFVVTGHGVPRATIEAAYHAAARLFDQPAEIKNALAPDLRDPLLRGLLSGDLERYSLSRLGEPGLAGGERVAHPIVSLPNKWPPSLPGFRAACLAYYTAVETVAQEVVLLFAIALGLPAGWFDDKFDNHMTHLVLNHYQPNSAAFVDREFRNDPHQDWGTMTILHQGDANGGLQIHDEAGRWLDIPPDFDSFVVHIGDLMNRWTNNRWVSALHRVVNAPSTYADQDRTSLALFYEPNHDAVLECIPTCSTELDPPRHAPITTYDYLAAKVRRAYVVGRMAGSREVPR